MAMLKSNTDLIMCRRLPGIAIGRVCERHDGECPLCSSLVHPETLVRICDKCNYGADEGKCIVCNARGMADAYYCAACTRLEHDRDGCPKIINIGIGQINLFHKKLLGSK